MGMTMAQMAKHYDLIFSDERPFLDLLDATSAVMELSGIPPTGKEVRVPLCVIYELDNDRITRARIYFETDALRQQT